MAQSKLSPVYDRGSHRVPWSRPKSVWPPYLLWAKELILGWRRKNHFGKAIVKYDKFAHCHKNSLFILFSGECCILFSLSFRRVSILVFPCLSRDLFFLSGNSTQSFINRDFLQAVTWSKREKSCLKSWKRRKSMSILDPHALWKLLKLSHSWHIHFLRDLDSSDRSWLPQLPDMTKRSLLATPIFTGSHWDEVIY